MDSQCVHQRLLGCCQEFVVYCNFILTVSHISIEFTVYAVDIQISYGIHCTFEFVSDSGTDYTEYVNLVAVEVSIKSFDNARIDC